MWLAPEAGLLHGKIQQAMQAKLESGGDYSKTVRKDVTGASLDCVSPNIVSGLTPADIRGSMPT